MIVRLDTGKPKTGRGRTGFTLLEILVVMSILGVVTSIGISAFVRLGDAWQSTRIMADLDREANNAFRMIEQDFASVVSSELSGISIHGVQRNMQPAQKGALTRYFDRVLADDAVVIPVPAGAGGEADIGLVSYSVNRSDDAHRLVRTIGDVTSSESEEEDSLPEMDVVNPGIAEVIRFRIEYSKDGIEWSTKWDEAPLPQAVRVSMTLEVPRLGGEYLQITRKAVFPIHVR